MELRIFVKMSLFLLLIFGNQAQAVAEVQKCDLSFKKTGICGQIVWTKKPEKVEMPTEKDFSEFNLILSKKTPIKDLTPKVILFMPSMGHGSRPTQVTRSQEGAEAAAQEVYKVTQVYFTMPGEWEIQVELLHGKKRVDRAVFKYEL